MRVAIAAVLVAALAGASAWGAWQNELAPPAGEARIAEVAATPLLSIRRVPEPLLRPRRDAQVAAVLDDLPARLPGASCALVRGEGRSLFEYAPETPLVPASTQKLLVAAALLEAMGPNETFRTVVRAGAEPSAGAIAGDLWIVGGGDPLLATEAFAARNEDQQRPFTRFEDLADAIVAAGVVRVDGSVVGDGTRYDGVLDVPTWLDRYREQVSAGPLSGLTVNQGLTTFTPERVVANPGVPAADPPQHAAALLTDLLVERGVEVGGPPRSGAAPAEAVEVAGIDSLPVSVILAHMMQWSDNTVAELLVKELGVRAGTEGSTSAGATALVGMLSGLAVDTDGVAVADGSGLDLGNRATCRTLVEVLDQQGPASPLADSLAVTGRSGTLDGRLADTPADGRVTAKTGSLRHVLALGGFAESDDGRTYTFAVITNLPEGEFMPAEAVDAHDELMLRLVTMPAVEVPAEMEPEPARSVSR